jgi:hypothetical protein
MALQATAILVDQSMAKLSQTVEREKRPAYAPRVFEPSIETPNVPLQRRRQRVDARR